MKRVNDGIPLTSKKELERYCQYLMDAALLQHGIDQEKSDELRIMFEKTKDLIDLLDGPQTMTFIDGKKIYI